MGGGSLFLCEYRYAGAVLPWPGPGLHICVNGSRESNKTCSPITHLKDVGPQGRQYNGLHQRLFGGTKARNIVPRHLKGSRGIAENWVAAETATRDGRDGNAGRDISSTLPRSTLHPHLIQPI